MFLPKFSSVSFLLHTQIKKVPLTDVPYLKNIKIIQNMTKFWVY